MKLTHKLLGHLGRIFDKGPGAVLALRLRYDAPMRWRVADGVLTTATAGGSGRSLIVDLGSHTVASLAAFLAQQPGYSVLDVDATTVPTFSALCLIDATGDPSESNGDHLQAYTSVLWAYLEAQAVELTLASASIAEALLQMAVPTAEGEWLDEHGSYYGVLRKPAELDLPYAGRMVAEVGRLRGNGVAMADALQRATQATGVAVPDVPVLHTAGDATTSLGWFDVELQLDPNSALLFPDLDPTVRSVIEAMRDAGSHLRTLRYVWTLRTPVYVYAALRVGVSVTVGAAYGGVIWKNNQGDPLLWRNNADVPVGWTGVGSSVVAGPGPSLSAREGLL